jgi:ATP-dependent DNA helicase RecG
MSQLVDQKTSFLSQSVSSLPKIGPKKSASLKKIGANTVRDLFFLFPRRYEDRTKFTLISDIPRGESVSVQGVITSLSSRYFRGKSHLYMTVKDESGSLQAIWFNQGYLKKSFEKDEEIILYGSTSAQGRLTMANPEYELCEEGGELAPIHMGRITPIYSLVSGLIQRSLRESLWQLVEDSIDQLEEYLPESIMSKCDLISLQDAIRQIHFPTSEALKEQARQRLIFDEFFLFQLLMMKRQEKFKATPSAFPMEDSEEIVKKFTSNLPFDLTDSQKNVFKEILTEMSSGAPSMRLLQGDVGSGKTVIAGGLLECALKHNYQAAILAPTETLAEQHYRSLKSVYDSSTGKCLRLLTGSLSEAEKAAIQQEIAEGKKIIVIGTHALLQEKVSFSNLGLVVIDEQHKFGVEQRSKLFKITPKPHFLLMTATPIPRSLAMTLYGDMNYSVLTELPKGRTPIKTEWVQGKEKVSAYEAIEARLSAGEQGYFVYPAIEETDKSKRKSCESDFPKIQDYYKNHSLELLHGRIPKANRQVVMDQFMKGDVSALVATTVIEVGIDNPNATFVVIQGAEFYGLSQLHQIRGRVGRGTTPSTCYLSGTAATPEARARFEIMTAVSDGFKIAEEDLKLRGPGDFLGIRQSGLPLFRIGNLITDREALNQARDMAEEFVHGKHTFTDEEGTLLEDQLSNTRYDINLV